MNVGAHDITKTHYCKASGCTNEARSPVGRYSYCPEHQGTASTTRAATTSPSSNGTAAALRDLLTLAKRVDKAKATAEKAQRAANEANRKADTLDQEYKNALAEAARGAVRIAA